MERTSKRYGADDGVSRRGFMGQVAATAGVAAIPGLLPRARAAEAGKSRVVIVKSEQLVRKYKSNPSAIQPMVDQLVCALTGKKKAEDAWAAIFKPDQRVGIKLNCLFPPVTTTPPLVDYVTKCLIKVGVKPGNIIVWDRADDELVRAGYKICKDRNRVRYMGTSTTFKRRDKDKPGYADHVGAKPIDTRLSRILTDEIDVLINMPVLKHHRLAGGTTASMKNHLGTVANPSNFHRDACRYVADLNMLEPIRTKTKLIIQDGTKSQYDGGAVYKPQFGWPYSGLLASFDTVAIDRIAEQEIGAKRRALGRSDVDVKHIDRAAKLGLGQGDPARIELIRLTV